MKREKDSALKALNREQLEYERELTLLRNDEAGRIEYVEMLEFRRKELDEKIKNNVSSETNNISSGFGKLKGKLPYPINGKIIDGYGKRYIKEAGVNFFNKGIKIAPKSDTDVLCIYTGNVVFADYMKGFENLVVVSHGDNYYTVYGNLTSLKVSQGDKISSGNSLGTISIDQDYNTSYLYFEIRLKENALNPVEWLISN